MEDNEKLGLLLYRCHLKTQRVVNRSLGPIGVKLRHLWIMSVASESPKSQSELCKRTDLNVNVMVRLLDELESRGYVKRKTSANDARERNITITPRGHKVLNSGIDIGCAQYSVLMSSFGRSEITTFFALLNKFVAK
jgi:MarR family transcriptional regulator, organic hydroperoxide resistance regulator